MSDLEKLDRARDLIGGLLTEASFVFKPGMKLTFIARRPDKPDQDFVMTDDDPAEAIAALERRTLIPSSRREEGEF